MAERHDDSSETPPNPRIARAAPAQPPVIALGVVAIASAGIATLALCRSPSGEVRPAPSAADPSQEAHVALVGAWRCTNKDGDFRNEETLTLLDGGRYTRQSHATKPGDTWMNLEEVSGGWQAVGDQLLFTAETCARYDATATKLCLPDHKLTQKLALPVADELDVGESCTPLKRITKRADP